MATFFLSTAPATREPFDILDELFPALAALPRFGSIGIEVLLVAAAATFALSLAATRRPELLRAARLAASGTATFVLFETLLLLYAFLTHDFRIRYVARHSDRALPLPYQFAALWGGQDGSLLWWAAILAVNILLCLWWMGRRHRAQQPYVLATLVSILGFFALMMTFSANPFAPSIMGSRPDGEGLNPQLQNFYMAIHPPSLYLGFVGASVPFAFAIAALATARLDAQWLRTIRGWMLVAWTFLSLGNALGMLWAYKRLGWGGYWSWDPVENASFMPWLAASAFVHSTMVQERRGMLKVWNVTLVALTFFLTIWGTFLTRAGLITSVHAFAQSSIGLYFAYFLGAVVLVVTGLIVLRLPELLYESLPPALAEAHRRDITPRLVQLLALFVLGSATVRYFTEALWPCALLCAIAVPLLAGHGLARVRQLVAQATSSKDDTQTNDLLGFALLSLLVPPFVLALGSYALTRKFQPAPKAPKAPTPEAAAEWDSLLSREVAFIANNWLFLAILAFVFAATHYPLLTEWMTGEKATVGPAFYNAWIAPLGLLLIALMGVAPLLAWRRTSPATFRRSLLLPGLAMGLTMAAHAAFGSRFAMPALLPLTTGDESSMEHVLALLRRPLPLLSLALVVFNLAVVLQEYVRGVQGRMRAHGENAFTALGQLVARARRRYGGYVVHAGIAFMFLGFTGAAYADNREFALRPGESAWHRGYQLTYLGPKKSDPEPGRIEVAMELEVRRGQQVLGRFAPTTVMFPRQNMSLSEVAIRPRLGEDLYLAVGAIDPVSKVGTLRVYVNPLTSWIWVGAAVLLLGAVMSLWPSAAEERRTATLTRAVAAAASLLLLSLSLALTPLAARSAHASPNASTHEKAHP